MPGVTDGAVLRGQPDRGGAGGGTPQGSAQAHHPRPDRKPYGGPGRLPPLHYLPLAQAQGPSSPAVSPMYNPIAAVTFADPLSPPRLHSPTRAVHQCMLVIVNACECWWRPTDVAPPFCKHLIETLHGKSHRDGLAKRKLCRLGCAKSAKLRPEFEVSEPQLQAFVMMPHSINTSEQVRGLVCQSGRQSVS